MQIIAHRALLNGPNKALENQPSTINLAISKGYLVEVDVWVIDGHWFLGHDGPEIRSRHYVLTTVADLDELLAWAPFAYFHAKNVFALARLLELAKDPSKKLKCFFHDIDEYTLTSNGLYGVYEEMRARQAQDLATTGEVFVDGAIQAPLVDQRRCVALYSFYDNWVPTSDFSVLQASLQLAFAQQNIYSVEQSASNVLHFTVMQILGFDQYQERVEEFESQRCVYEQIIKAVLSKYLPFKITFRGLMAIKSGLVMVGYPSLDVTSTIRRELEDLFHSNGLFYRKYTNNIVHSTIVRCSTPEPGLAKRLVEFAALHQDTYFGEATIGCFELGHSSWRMQAKELAKNTKI
ncbi:hypothetical protein HDU91_006364 [Kappamyces sp. JEL0680]|nr:hypothetical protein HDU91_006364 [Kappamyces sp. JEL0680]